jgi:VCBS repeat-containing protein
MTRPRSFLSLLRPRTRRKPHQSRGKSALCRPRLELLESRDLLSAFSLGSTGFDSAYSVKLDAAGNAYVFGTFNGTVDFDPGPGVHNLTSSTNNASSPGDAFLAKYSPTGQLIWVGQLSGATAGSSSGDAALTLDGNGNVLVTGSFSGTTDFDIGPGTSTLTAAGNFGNAFVAEYTAAGGLLWARRLGGAAGGTVAGLGGETIAVDAAGNVYTAGVLSNGQADMDPGPGTSILINSSGNANTYISKLDASGNFVWAKQFQNDPTIGAGVWPEDMGVDANQQVYISGIFVNRVNFDTSGGTHWVTAADTPGGNYGDAYVARLTAAGNLDYVATMGTAHGRDDGYGIAVDAAGNAYVTGAYGTVFGQTTSPLIITPATGSGTQIPVSPGTSATSGNIDIFILKLNPAGGLDWAHGLGGPGFDGGQTIEIGPDGLYLAGFFNGTVNVNPNGGPNNVTSPGGSTDVFVLKLATDSTYLNSWSIGGSDFTYAYDLGVNNSGEVGVVGRFFGGSPLNTGPGGNTLSNAGSSDAFVILFSQPNHPPVASDGTLTTNEDTAATGTLTASDPDGNALTFAVVSGPAHGTLQVNATTGAFTYKPALNYNGPDSFTFKANDGQADSNVATVSITVTPVNDPPFPSPVVQNVTTPEDTPLSGQVHGVDVDGDPLTFSLVQGPSHGTLTFNADGSYTYTPAANYNGPDAFVFRVADPSGASNLGGVSITVTPVNDAPNAVDDAYSVNEDSTLVVSVAPVTRLRMVSDPGDFIGQGLTYDFNPATATFTGQKNFDNGASLTVDPPAPGEFWFLDFAAAGNVPLSPGVYLNAMRYPFQDASHPGLDVSGNGRGSNTLTGQFAVYDVVFNGNVLTNFAAAFEQHSEGAAPALVGWIMLNTTFGAGGGVLANDTDVDGDLLLSATLVSGPAHGTLSFRGDGTFTYTPNPNFNGTDSFTYRTSDGRLDSNVATVTITVNPVNDPPVAANDSYSTAEDTPLTVAAPGVLGNDTDVDGDSLSAVLVSGPAHGTLTLNSNGSFTYTPAPNYNGPDSFSYKANDGQADSNVATVSLTITPVNDPPVAGNDSYTTAEDTPLTVAAPGVLGNDTDVDGDPLQAILVAGPAHGTLALNANGSFTYTPSANYNGGDSFSYKANDGQADSNIATVSLTITPVNDPPVANNDSYTVPAGATLTVAAPGVLGNDSDVDGDSLTAILVAGPAHGTLALNASGSFTYTPAAGFSGPDTFTYRASDGSLGAVATVTISVTPAPATPGKVTGGGSIDGGVRRFNIDVQSREGAGGLSFTGQVSFEDRQLGIRLASTSITYLRVEADGIHATIGGTATVNGVGGYTFTVYVEDNGEPGRNDKFRIVLTGPRGFAYDSLDYALLGGLLDSGNIQVHKK